MKRKKGLKVLIGVFFFFSFLSSVYLFQPLDASRSLAYPYLLEQVKIEKDETSPDVKVLKAVLNFAKRYLPIS